jgi:hypothetical protein
MCQKIERTCVICDKKLIGRSDKRFCNIKCKNKYHSELRASKKTFSQDVFKLILNNHRILADLLGPKNQRYQIKKIVLQRKGFDVDTITSAKIVDNEIIYQVLDFTWKNTKNNLIEVEYNPNEQTISPYVFKRFERFGLKETTSIAENINSTS